MKTETAVASGWEDLIFENRNKEYGAYDIRKSYSGNTTTAMMICLLAAAGLLLLSGFSFLSDKKIVMKTDDEGMITISVIPPIEPIQPPAQKVIPPPVKPIASDLPLVVTTKDVQDQPENITPATPGVEGTGDPNGVEVVTGSVGTEPVESLPTIPMDKVFNGAEVMPSYVNGMEAMMRYLQNKLRYPSRAQRMEIQGTVYVGFVVNREGKVVDVYVVRGISEECDKEAVRVISAMPAWKPGSQQGFPVSVRMVLPVTFRLNPSR